VARIFVLVEGETEETFVQEILSSHLLQHGHQTSARLIGNARLRSRRGGIQGWTAVAADVVRRLTEDQGCFVTTMVDYYALPQTGQGAWPGRAEAANLDFPAKGPAVCSAIGQDIAARMNPNYDPATFIPYVMMHEFEGLLFSDCKAFARGIGQDNLAGKFQSIRDQFLTSEAINDSPVSAPSKRVQELVRGYQKPLMGTLAALEIGLDAIRADCPHFHAWIMSLEALA
jgi:hypothetical protein